MAHERQSDTIRTLFLPVTINESPENIVCLFSQSQVVEILGPRPVQKIPGSPPYLKGMLLYHDTLLPVVNLDDLCNQGRNSQPDRYKQLMVIRTGMVDPETAEPLKVVVGTEVRARIAKISGQELATAFMPQEPPPALGRSGLLRGCFQRHGDLVAVLDLGPVVLGTFSDRMAQANP